MSVLSLHFSMQITEALEETQRCDLRILLHVASLTGFDLEISKHSLRKWSSREHDSGRGINHKSLMQKSMVIYPKAITGLLHQMCIKLTSDWHIQENDATECWGWENGLYHFRLQTVNPICSALLHKTLKNRKLKQQGEHPPPIYWLYSFF